MFELLSKFYGNLPEGVKQVPAAAMLMSVGQTSLTSIRAGWFFSESAFYYPVFKSPSHASVGDSESFSPIRYAKRLILKRNKSNLPRVPLLFLACSPSTIAWLIVSVVIDAIQSRAEKWPLSHVGNKVFKFTPTITDLYAATAVIFILFKARVTASGDHAAPNFVKRRVGSSMSASANSRCLAQQTATTPRVSVLQVKCCNYLASAARTFAKPSSRIVPSDASKLNDSQSRENLTAQVIYAFWQGSKNSRIGRNHGLLQSSCGLGLVRASELRRAFV